MATSTTNLGLTKPAGTDKIRIAQINGNMDILDEKIGAVGNTSLQAQVTSQNQAIAKVQNGLAYIVGNTNTTGATLAVGQFVYVKGHSTIAEGLRKVTASISANGNITTSNTTECSEGGLNALNSKTELTITAGTHTVIDANKSYICGNIMIINFKCHATSAISGSETIATIEKTTIFDGVVPIFKGGEWSVTGALYGYVTGKSVVSAGISNGEYVHVNFATLLA